MKNIINTIKRNKSLLYVSLLLLIIAFSVVLNYTFSAFTQSTVKSAADITVSDLVYNTSVNGTNTNIISTPANTTTKSNVVLTADNKYDTKYEITYQVCSDSACNTIVNKPNDFEVYISSTSTDAVNGTITSDGSKYIRLVIKNDTNTNYYIKIGINSGYAYNALTLTGQISDEYIENDLVVKVIVDDVEQTAFPTVPKYYTDVSCIQLDGQTISTTGTVTYNENAGIYVFSVSNLTNYRTECTITFTSAPHGYYTAPSNTLLGTIATINPDSYIPWTTAGVTPSLDIEDTIAASRDDYGVSFYYRGAVHDNYVVFANMCWRIVRITGDGSIKITLYNYNPTGSSTPCDSSLDARTYAYARMNDNDSYSFTSEFNPGNDVSTYIGFMYSNNPNSRDFATAHANDRDSVILTNLKTWYDAKFTAAQKNQLADVIWCNDKRVVTDLTYNPFNYDRILATGLGNEETLYQATKRLWPYNPSTSTYGTENAQASLKCGDSKTDNLISKFTASTQTDGGYGNGKLNGYKIGLLTADEIAYAGGLVKTQSTTYYLYKNANEGYYAYWTMTPAATFQYGTDVFEASPTVDLNLSLPNSTFGIRPTIALKSSVTIVSGGDGTQANPFVIN